MKVSCALVVVIGIYIVLDLSLPAMPGAFVFDPEDSVESARASRDRSDVAVVRPRVPVPWITVVPVRESVPVRVVPSRHVHRVPRSSVPPAASIAAPPPSSEDSH